MCVYHNFMLVCQLSPPSMIFRLYVRLSVTKTRPLVCLKSTFHNFLSVCQLQMKIFINFIISFSGTAEHTATHTHVADHSHEHEHVHRHKHNHIHDETAEHDHQHREGHTHRHKQDGYGSRRRGYEKLAVDRTKELLKTYMASQYSRMTGFGK